MIALPMPAATRPCTVGLSFERKREPRLDAAPSESCFDGLDRSVRREADERLCADLLKRRRRGGEREGRAFRDDQQVRVAQQLDRVEGRVGNRQEHEADVELAALERALDLVVVHLDKHDVDGRPRGR